uniref:Uncharacterized protein n=1 Tax=Oryza glumipatula TaxID=40148 RepID=A0A0D9ZPC3_9ORYZ
MEAAPAPFFAVDSGHHDGFVAMFFLSVHGRKLSDQGEEHKLFWPYQTGFVRMEAQFNATMLGY